MQFRKLALSVAAVTALGAFSSANAYTTHEEQIIVHPFQWTYDMIADECEEVRRLSFIRSSGPTI